eukprot:8524841-Alexandrium_andersonii.AAC.1
MLYSGHLAVVVESAFSATATRNKAVAGFPKEWSADTTSMASLAAAQARQATTDRQQAQGRSASQSRRTAR